MNRNVDRSLSVALDLFTELRHAIFSIEFAITDSRDVAHLGPGAFSFFFFFFFFINPRNGQGEIYSRATASRVFATETDDLLSLAEKLVLAEKL